MSLRMDQPFATLPSGVVMMYGNPLKIEEKDGHRRTVKASYSIMRVLQLRHIAALNSTLVLIGRYKLGTPRLLERELLVMMMQGSCP
jgi:hypothetical protein